MPDPAVPHPFVEGVDDTTRTQLYRNFAATGKAIDGAKTSTTVAAEGSAYAAQADIVLPGGDLAHLAGRRLSSTLAFYPDTFTGTAAVWADLTAAVFYVPFLSTTGDLLARSITGWAFSGSTRVGAYRLSRCSGTVDALHIVGDGLVIEGCNLTVTGAVTLTAGSGALFSVVVGSKLTVPGGATAPARAIISASTVDGNLTVEDGGVFNSSYVVGNLTVNAGKVYVSHVDGNVTVYGASTVIGTWSGTLTDLSAGAATIIDLSLVTLPDADHINDVTTGRTILVGPTVGASLDTADMVLKVYNDNLSLLVGMAANATDSDYTIVDPTRLLTIGGLSAPRTVTLPSTASTPGAMTERVVWTDATCTASTTVTVVPAVGETIEGGASYVVAAERFVVFVPDPAVSTNWLVVPDAAAGPTGLSDLTDVSDTLAPTPGQVLTFDGTTWDAATPHGLPAGGATGQVLAKNSATDFDASWAAVGGGGGGDDDLPWLLMGG